MGMRCFCAQAQIQVDKCEIYWWSLVNFWVDPENLKDKTHYIIIIYNYTETLSSVFSVNLLYSLFI